MSNGPTPEQVENLRYGVGDPERVKQAGGHSVTN